MTRDYVSDGVVRCRMIRQRDGMADCYTDRGARGQHADRAGHISFQVRAEQVEAVLKPRPVTPHDGWVMRY